MKKLLCSAALVLFAVLPARAEVRIAFVDTARAFEAFYKTNDLAAHISAKSDRFKKEIHDMQVEYQQASLDAQSLEMAAKSPANSAAVRKENDATLAQKVRDLELMDQEITRVRRDRGKEINDELSRDHQLIYDEIIKVIAVYSAAQGYDLVLDKRASARGSIMPFTSGRITDLTSQIITRLNASHHTH